MNISNDVRKNIYKYLGDRTDNFLSQVTIRIKKYTSASEAFEREKQQILESCKFAYGLVAG